MDTAALPEYAGQVVLDGKTYDVPLPDEPHYAEMADWLTDRALARVEQMRGSISEQVYQGRYDACMRMVCAGVLSAGQPEFDRAMGSLEGREQLLWIVLKSRYVDVSRDQVRRLFHGILTQAVAASVTATRKQSEATTPQSEVVAEPQSAATAAIT